MSKSETAIVPAMRREDYDAGAKRVFIDALMEGKSVGVAAKLAGRDKVTFYRWKRQDGQFALDWHHAVDVGSTHLEELAELRAINGSDRMLLALLRARKPFQYCPLARKFAIEKAWEAAERSSAEGEQADIAAKVIEQLDAAANKIIDLEALPAPSEAALRAPDDEMAGE